MPSIPTAQLICCPLPQVGRRISASPLNSLLLVWGQTQYSRARQGWGQQWQTDTGPRTFWPPWHSPLPSSGALAKWGAEKLPVANIMGGSEEVPSSPITCTSHSPRNKPKKESRRRPRDRGEKSQVFTQLHGIFMAKRTFSSFEYWGISFVLNTSILDPISETGLKPLNQSARNSKRTSLLLLGFIVCLFQ